MADIIYPIALKKNFSLPVILIVFLYFSNAHKPDQFLDLIKVFLLSNLSFCLSFKSLLLLLPWLFLSLLPSYSFTTFFKFINFLIFFSVFFCFWFYFLFTFFFFLFKQLLFSHETVKFSRLLCWLVCLLCFLSWNCRVIICNLVTFLQFPKVYNFPHLFLF